jgi:hypothetical protein
MTRTRLLENLENTLLRRKYGLQRNDGGKSESVTWLIDGVDTDESYLSHHIVVYRLVTPVQLHLFQNAIGSLSYVQIRTELRILPVQFMDLFGFIKQNRPLHRNALHTRTDNRHCTYKQVLACIE